MREVKSVGERVHERKRGCEGEKRERLCDRQKERKGNVNSQQTEKQSPTLTGEQSVYKDHR